MGIDFVLILFILKKVNKHVSFLNVVQIKKIILGF